MKKHCFLFILLFFSLFITLFSCGDDDEYIEIIEPEPTSPVVVDLNAVPYAKLSDYKFYTGELKNLEPALGVLPYDLNSALFTDYAHKKRFVWMPANAKASYTTDSKILDFPSGAVLIKNFYYNNVQPANTTRIIETRLMIKKGNDWIFANYIWNNEQTEAYLNMDGGYADITWNEDGTNKTTSYRIPSGTECLTCHKSEEKPIPIGPKPQNLNKIYNYSDGAKNQLTKWIEAGYLNNTVPQNITSTVDWTDTSLPIDIRVRSYLDINCAHCHSEGAHCDYRPIRLAFSETSQPVNLGICVEAQEDLNGSFTYIIKKGSKEKSVLYHRLSTTIASERMPLLGRSIAHNEAVTLIGQWIDAMEEPCP